ncbi:MAG: hypothetical protein D6765_03035, partial [Bacteroidetes bacterium]
MGGSGTCTLQWQSSPDQQSWTDIPGANAPTLTVQTPTQTTYFRAVIACDGGGCDTQTSNVDSVVVIHNFTSGGQVGSDEEMCGPFDPALITELTAPSGGNGGGTSSIEYQWEARTLTGGWAEIPGATSSTYDPPSISETMVYRRKIRRSPCTDWVLSNEVLKTVVENPQDGGVLAGDETQCDAYDPAEITSQETPVCEQGTREFRWLERRFEGGGWTVWEVIQGAQGATFDPPTIQVTTQFVREVRCAPCTDWVRSDTVQKTVIFTPQPADDAFSTCPETQLQANVLSNDQTLSNPVLSILLAPQNGSATLSNDGTLQYTPNDQFCGQDTLQYQVCNEGSSCCAIATVIIEVTDSEAPQLQNVPADLTLECDQNVPAPPNVTATDDCDTDVTISFSETETPGDCPDSYTLTRTWTATDNCGNASTATQTLVVQDTEAPVLAGVPDDLTVECDEVPDPASPTASDNCDSDVEITFAEVRTDGDCPDSYTLTRTWTATDNCGNASTATQTLVV